MSGDLKDGMISIGKAKAEETTFRLIRVIGWSCYSYKEIPVITLFPTQWVL